MPLTAGARLGPYEVVSALGAGGMGEVYKARDTRLDRAVAIKILPETLAADSQFRERFDREARAISQLTHPHICTLYDVGEQAGAAYLVMELLDGETLAARLERGALPLSEALTIAVQIASALDKAHRSGITHRDLKPGNIMLTKAGAKLLDFGLAKTRAAAVAGAVLSMVPTTPANLTAQGTILGTFQYMAPEQLEGQEADARTDIFAFGAVLYEMLTGRKAFEGKSHVSLIGAILKDDPPAVSQVQPIAPPMLDRIVKKCLAKEPEQRWQSAGDLADQLRWIAEGASSVFVAPARQSGTVTKLAAMSAIAVLLVVASIILTMRYFLPAGAAPGTVRFSIDRPGVPPPSDVVGQAAPAISPDGRYVAFVTADPPSGPRSIWMRSLDSLASRQLMGTEGAGSPVWSPDSRSLAFFVGGQLKRIDLAGGVAQTLCDAPNNQGAAWGPMGVIVFGTAAVLRQVSEDGGTVEVVTTTEPGQETAHSWPAFLPDGRTFVFLARSSQADKSALFAGSLGSNETRRIMASNWQAMYANGYLFFLREGVLMAQAFDPESLTLRDGPSVVAEQVMNSPANGRGAFSVSANGTVASIYGAGPNVSLTWFDRNGREVGTVGVPGDYRQVNLSLDNRKIVTDRFDPKTGIPEIWLMEPERNVSTKFTISTSDRDPIWSGDGRRIVFSSRRKGPSADMYVKTVGGNAEEELVLDTEESVTASDWSKDGRYLLYISTSPGLGQGDVYALPMTGEPKPIPVVLSQFNEDEARFSFDGRWVAYNSNESGSAEVFAVPFPRADEKIQISNQGGVQARWRADGRELFYLAPDGKMMSVELSPGSTLKPGTPRVVFQTRLSVNAQIDQFAVTADGDRFLMPVPMEDSRPLPITIILNWRAPQ